MRYGDFKKPQGAAGGSRTSDVGRAPGKRTLTADMRPRSAPDAPIQQKRDAGSARAASAAGGSGHAMPEEVQAKMEGAFGADFSAVRVHEGGEAGALGALAYAQGTDIHFQPGQYDPHSTGGQELLGHELAHVVQQSQGRVSAPVQGKGAPVVADPALEREADEMGILAARGEPVGAAAGAIEIGADASAPIQGKIVEIVNISRVADQIHKAIAGVGTDEQAVFSALASLDHRKADIDELRATYKSRFGNTLDEDIRDDFSGSELSYAMSLLQPRAEDVAAEAATAAATATGLPAPAATAIGNAAGAVVAAIEPDYDKLAERCNHAMDRVGTDEEAVYAVLASLNGDSARIAKLEAAYQSKYSKSLRAEINDEFSGDELKHCLELLGSRSTSEKVNVATDEEAKKAKEIIQQLYDLYGVDVNSQAGVDAIYARYTNVPTSVRDMLKTKEWEYKELVALKSALDRFAPILGEKRKDSTRSDADQEITTVSKVDQAIDTNTAAGVLDNTTLGEYFEASKNFSMTTKGTNSTMDFPGDNPKQLEGTAIHEIAHGLMKYALDDFIATLDYWDGHSNPSGKVGAEAPITAYGSSNAGEDLSETVMYYFVEPATLKAGKGPAKGTVGNPCPDRFAFVEKSVKAWKKETK